MTTITTLYTWNSFRAVFVAPAFVNDVPNTPAPFSPATLSKVYQLEVMNTAESKCSSCGKGNHICSILGPLRKKAVSMKLQPLHYAH